MKIHTQMKTTSWDITKTKMGTFGGGAQITPPTQCSSSPSALSNSTVTS